MQLTDDSEQQDIFTWHRSEALLTEHPHRCIFIYYVYLIHLYIALCYGRNAMCQELLETQSMALDLGLDEDNLVSIVTSTQLPLALRSVCLKVCARDAF